MSHKKAHSQEIPRLFKLSPVFLLLISPQSCPAFPLALTGIGVQFPAAIRAQTWTAAHLGDTHTHRRLIGSA